MKATDGLKIKRLLKLEDTPSFLFLKLIGRETRIGEIIKLRSYTSEAAPGVEALYSGLLADFASKSEKISVLDPDPSVVENLKEYMSELGMNCIAEVSSFSCSLKLSVFEAIKREVDSGSKVVFLSPNCDFSYNPARPVNDEFTRSVKNLLEHKNAVLIDMSECPRFGSPINSIRFFQAFAIISKELDCFSVEFIKNESSFKSGDSFKFKL